MKIEEIEIWKLIPYEFNNKIHDETQINRIANSIKEFWFLQPVVIDKNNVIVVWHGSVEWAKKLWLKKVPCVRAENLTETQIKKYRILDNKLNESAWDVESLKVELDELWDLNVWDIELKPDELFGDILVNDEEDEDPEVKEDEAPKANSKAKILGGGIIRFMKSSFDLRRCNKNWGYWNIDWLKKNGYSLYRSAILNVFGYGLFINEK